MRCLCQGTRFQVASDELDHNLWRWFISVNTIELMRHLTVSRTLAWKRVVYIPRNRNLLHGVL
jgi:hypothetical protein